MTFLADLARAGFVMPAESSTVPAPRPCGGDQGGSAGIALACAPPTSCSSLAATESSNGRDSRAGGLPNPAEMREDRHGENAPARPSLSEVDRERRAEFARDAEREDGVL